MNEQQKLDMAGITFINWLQIHHSNPDKLKERNQEVYDSSFICKVIDNRMKTFNIDIHIPDHLIVLIDLCTGSNPGMSFMMLSEILEKIPDLKYGHLIQPDDFVRVYGSKFPILSMYSDISDRLEKKWDMQKLETPKDFDTDNQCDYKYYWTRFFK